MTDYISPSYFNCQGRLLGYLGCDEAMLQSLKDNRNINSLDASVPLFRKIELPKRRNPKEYRTVYSISELYAQNIYKALKFYLNNIYTPLPCVHGFVRGRGIVTNASEHLNRKVLLNVDIQDFFECISIQSIKAVYISLGFVEEIATLLSEITTVDGKLVAGLPTSPILANIACIAMDNELIELSKQSQLTYTRYADDLSFSGDADFDILEEVKEILAKYKFTIKASKTRKFYKGHNQYVTGLSVADSVRPRIPRYYKKKIRAEIYCINSFGLKSETAKHYGFPIEEVDEILMKKRLAYILGKISFYRSVEPEFAQVCYRNLLSAFESCEGKRIFEDVCSYMEGQFNR